MKRSDESSMNLLALEFSSPQRSVAVIASARVAGEVIDSSAGNTMRPLGMIETALKRAGQEREQIECVAVGLGPGSYTGVRVAIALAQGWQLARGVKLLGLNSAECLAAEAQREGLKGRVTVVVDAQRDEFYLAVYEIGATAFRETEALRLATKAELLARQEAGELLIGPEVTRWFSAGRLIFPRAATLGITAQERKDFVAANELETIHLRETKFVKAPPARVVS